MADRTGDRLGALVMLVSSSIGQQRRRSLLQVTLVAVVVVTGGACVVAGRGGGQSIVDAVDTSGASVYRVSANNRDTGEAEPVDVAVVATLEQVGGLSGVSGQTQFDALVTPAIALEPQRRRVTAVTRSFAGLGEARVVVGLPVFAANARPYGVLLGRISAHELGVTPECVRQQRCEVLIDGDPFVVSAIIESDTRDLGDAVLIDLEVATAEGRIGGADELAVVSNGLPAVDTRRSLDLILSQSTDQVIFVAAPSAAAALREGVNSTWTRTIGALAVLVLAMGVAGQIAIQRSIVRSRHVEIATLRSIGYSPRFIVTQFVTEPLLLAAAGSALGAGALLAASVTAREVFDYDLALPVAATTAMAANALVVSAGASMLAARAASQVSPAEVLHR